MAAGTSRRAQTPPWVKRAGLLSGPALFLATFALPAPEGLGPEGQAVFGL